MDELRAFLASPEDKDDEFWESDSLIWIDWREFDESIIKYFNEKLPDEDKIVFRCVKTDKERDIDIILEKNDVSSAIPYADECTDRDTTLRSIQKYLEPEYQIRWYMESLGSDTLAFCIGTAMQWKQLEDEFGADKVSWYFAPVKDDSVMFEMDMNEVFNLMDKRNKAE